MFANRSTLCSRIGHITPGHRTCRRASEAWSHPEMTEQRFTRATRRLRRCASQPEFRIGATDEAALSARTAWVSAGSRDSAAVARQDSWMAGAIETRLGELGLTLP